MPIHNILVVDDDALSREFLVEAVRALGYDAQAAETGDEGLRLAKRTRPDLVLSDLRMPGMDGIELVRELQSEYPGLPCVVITAHGSVDAAVEAMQSGARDFLLKPCSHDALDVVIRRVDKMLRLEHENAYLRAEVTGGGAPQVIAESAAMRETLEAAKRLANSKGTVLITGESGTGKERVAQFIHYHSSRATGPFIRVNCAALSETLLESELFGHEKGSFTGAHKARPGRFELADGGTLLLDEIGEISPALQAKLLRVLEEEEFERVGGTSTMRVNVRVLATTNRDLSEEVKQGRFREDLFYRLHVLPLHLAPLRQRAADILPLAEHFIEHYAAQNGVPVPSIGAEAMLALERWSWPGNVRELENVLQRAVVLGQGSDLEPQSLLFGPSTSRVAPSAASEVRDTQHGPSNLVNRKLAEVEREAILATLSSASGNKTEAARRLGVSARTLSNKMKIWRAAGLVA